MIMLHRVNQLNIREKEQEKHHETTTTTTATIKYRWISTTIPPRPQVPIVEVTIPLKYLSNFWRFLDLPLTNCETELDLLWKKDCVLIEHHSTITGVNFMITSTKRWVPGSTLSINDNIRVSEKMKQWLKRTIPWYKYRSDKIK